LRALDAWIQGRRGAGRRGRRRGTGGESGGKFIEDKVWVNGGMGHCGRIWVGAEGCMDPRKKGLRRERSLGERTTGGRRGRMAERAWEIVI
jgi:hypothetical protein